MLSVPPFQTLLRFYSHLTSRLAFPPLSFFFIFLSFSSLSRARAHTHTLTRFSVSLYFRRFLTSLPRFPRLRSRRRRFPFSLRDTTRPFNRVAFSLTRHPSVPSSIPLQLLRSFFDFLTLLASLPAVSTALPTISSSSGSLLSPSLYPTWRVIPRKPWYFVGHGVQSHGGPDEA